MNGDNDLKPNTKDDGPPIQPDAQVAANHFASGIYQCFSALSTLNFTTNITLEELLPVLKRRITEESKEADAFRMGADSLRFSERSILELTLTLNTTPEQQKKNQTLIDATNKKEEEEEEESNEDGRKRPPMNPEGKEIPSPYDGQKRGQRKRTCYA